MGVGSKGTVSAASTSGYYGQSALPLPIDWKMCEDIKRKIWTLGLSLPMAAPTVPWIYCPSCKSFFTTFSKFNDHFATTRHALSMEMLNEVDRQKMNELLQYIQEKEEQEVQKAAGMSSSQQNPLK